MSRYEIYVSKEYMYFPYLLCEILRTLVALIFFSAYVNLSFKANDTA